MKKGQKLNRPPHKHTGIRVEADLWYRCQALAREQRTSASSILQRCLDNWLPVLEEQSFGKAPGTRFRQDGNEDDSSKGK